MKAWLYDNIPGKLRNEMYIIDGPRDVRTNQITETVQDIAARHSQQAKSPTESHGRSIAPQSSKIWIPSQKKYPMATMSETRTIQYSMPYVFPMDQLMFYDIFQKAVSEGFVLPANWQSDDYQLVDGVSLPLGPHQISLHSSRSPSVSTASSGSGPPSDGFSVPPSRNGSLNPNVRMEPQSIQANTSSASSSPTEQIYQQPPNCGPAQAAIRPIKVQVKTKEKIEFAYVPKASGLHGLNRVFTGLLHLKPRDFDLSTAEVQQKTLCLNAQLKNGLLAKRIVRKLALRGVKIGGASLDIVQEIDWDNVLLPDRSLIVESPPNTDDQGTGPVIIDGSVTD